MEILKSCVIGNDKQDTQERGIHKIQTPFIISDVCNMWSKSESSDKLVLRCNPTWWEYWSHLDETCLLSLFYICTVTTTVKVHPLISSVIIVSMPTKIQTMFPLGQNISPSSIMYRTVLQSHITCYRCLTPGCNTDMAVSAQLFLDVCVSGSASHSNIRCWNPEPWSEHLEGRRSSSRQRESWQRRPGAALRLMSAAQKLKQNRRVAVQINQNNLANQTKQKTCFVVRVCT